MELIKKPPPPKKIERRQVEKENGNDMDTGTNRQISIRMK